MCTKTNYQIDEFFTRDGREIFRLKKIDRDGISGELVCVYSESSIYEVGETETDLLSRYDRVELCKYPNLIIAIGNNNLHLQLSPEALTEVIRQAYTIGVRDGEIHGEQEPRAVLHRCSYIYRDINQQLLNGPLSLYKYDLEPEEPRVVPNFLREITVSNWLRNK